MKSSIYAFVVTVLIILGAGFLSHADTVPVAAPAVAVPAPAVVVSPAAAQAIVSGIPAVAVPEPAAPPQWASDILVGVQKLPIVGPYASKIILYLGILAAIITSLCACLMSILSALKGIANLSGLDSFSAAITAFQAGPIMYWLKYLSNFNAKKPSA